MIIAIWSVFFIPASIVFFLHCLVIYGACVKKFFDFDWETGKAFNARREVAASMLVVPTVWHSFEKVPLIGILWIYYNFEIGIAVECEDL